ncbi:MAG: hypothetical protein KKH01_03885 [Firmicutes bacterium]|nr:hypothetical protein [Bacillota bacterium]
MNISTKSDSRISNEISTNCQNDEKQNETSKYLNIATNMNEEKNSSYLNNESNDSEAFQYNKKLVMDSIKGMNSIDRTIDRIDSYYLDFKQFSADVVNSKDEYDKYRASFDFEDVDGIRSDLKLIRSGSLFVWIIGKESRDRTQKRISYIKFRRTPSWTKEKIDEEYKNAINRAEYFRKLTAENPSKE